MSHWFVQTHIASDRSREPLVLCERFDAGDETAIVLFQSRSPSSEARRALALSREFVKDLAEGGLPRDPDDWESELRRLDRALHLSPDAGTLFGIAATLDGGGIVGASLGDCAAWLLGDASWQVTRMQHRLTFLGTGDARPIGFGPVAIDDLLFAGTQSLFEQIPAMEAAEILRDASDDAPNALTRRLRKMGMGRLQTDVGFLIVRRRH